MESHASKRDDYGIPIIHPGTPIIFDYYSEEEVARTRIQTEELEKLQEKTENLRQLHYTVDLLEKWMFSNTSLAKKRRFATRTDQDIEDMSRTVDDEIECLEAHRKDILGTIERLLDLQRSLARYLIGPHTDCIPDVQTPSNPFSTPRWLLRAFHDKLYCQRDRFGIRSSGYMSSDPGSSFDDLIKTQVISEKSLRNHCGGSERTPFISMADDPAWLLHFVKSLSFLKWTRIALINVKKLELVGVVYGQASDWATKAGAKPCSAKNEDGVHYLGPTHWLAYGWIPFQCIDKVWSLNDFRQVCSKSGIPEDGSSIFRVSVEKVVAESSNDLSNRFKASLKLQ